TAIAALGDLATKDEIGSADIADNSITDFDVASNAAIAGGKINPDFGNQNVTTTGSLTAASANIGQAKFKAASNTGVITLKAPDNQALDKTFTLPGTFGSSGQFLKSDGAGGLTWDSLTAQGVLVGSNN